MTASTFVNQSLAKGLSKRSLEYLVEAASMCSRTVDDFLRKAITAQALGKSPAKLANQLRENMSALMAQPCIHGRLSSVSARNFIYAYIRPDLKDDHLVFSIAIGSINTRSKLSPNQQHLIPAVQITRHSVERLHQRLNTTDFDDIYAEICTITMLAPSMNMAARHIGARQWALPAVRGMFVAVPGDQDYMTTLVTWLPFDNLSTKWSRLVADLQALPELDDFSIRLRPELVEIMLRHRWLLEPYEPPAELPIGPGAGAVAWPRN
ncbi:MAG: hypothetical protein RLY71_1036 [Pseudomonadota bacterium]|jgi:hypothetical protein